MHSAKFFKFKILFKISSTPNVTVASVNSVLVPLIKHSMPNPSCHLKALILQILIYIHMYHGSPPPPSHHSRVAAILADIEQYVHVIHG